MRSLLVVCVLLGAASCRTAAPQQGFHWTSNSQTSLGVTVDVDREWKTTALDNVVLLAPTSTSDDFAIVLVRSQEQDEDVLRTLGTLERIEMKLATKPSPRVHEMETGTAMLQSSHKPVMLRLARINDASTHATYVVALIAQPSGSRGTEAFDHVLQSLVIHSASADHAVLPAWLDAPPPKRQVPDDPTDDDSSGSDAGDEP